MQEAAMQKMAFCFLLFVFLFFVVLVMRVPITRRPQLMIWLTALQRFRSSLRDMDGLEFHGLCPIGGFLSSMTHVGRYLMYVRVL